MSRALSIFASLALSAVVATPVCNAQTTSATLTGVVTDSRGAELPRAHLAIHTANNTVNRSVTADDAGHFSISLAPDTYVVDADAAGFDVTHKNVVVSADKPVNLTLVLKISDITQIVNVEIHRIVFCSAT